MEERVADHLATIDWQRGAWSDKKGKYSRQHIWVLAGARLKASESGAVTPAAYRDNTSIDPHNMFVASEIASRVYADELAGGDHAINHRGAPAGGR